jgi:hypothetical protein
VNRRPGLVVPDGESVPLAKHGLIRDIRYSRIANDHPMDLKPQDLLVLLKVAAHPPQRWTYATLGETLAMSVSEAHASVKRAVASGGGARAWRMVARAAEPPGILRAWCALHLVSHARAGQAGRADGFRR